MRLERLFNWFLWEKTVDLKQFVVGLYDTICDRQKGEITYRLWNKRTGELVSTLRDLNRPLDKDDGYYKECESELDDD